MRDGRGTHGEGCDEGVILPRGPNEEVEQRRELWRHRKVQRPGHRQATTFGARPCLPHARADDPSCVAVVRHEGHVCATQQRVSAETDLWRDGTDAQYLEALSWTPRSCCGSGLDLRPPSSVTGSSDQNDSDAVESDATAEPPATLVWLIHLNSESPQPYATNSGSSCAKTSSCPHDIYLLRSCEQPTAERK